MYVTGCPADKPALLDLCHGVVRWQSRPCDSLAGVRGLSGEAEMLSDAASAILRLSI